MAVFAKAHQENVLLRFIAHFYLAAATPNMAHFHPSSPVQRSADAVRRKLTS